MCARDYINREVDGSLSGGELKRIEIATIIARGYGSYLFLTSRRPVLTYGALTALLKVFEKMQHKNTNSILNYFTSGENFGYCR